MKSRSIIPVALLLVGFGALAGVSSLIHRQTNPEDYLSKPKQETQETPKSTPSPSVQELLDKHAYYEPCEIATITTSQGVFKVALYEKDMPATCKNFVGLVKKGFYKNLKFHRVEDWVVQGGDPKGDGSGGSGKPIKLETKTGLGFDKPYAVGMARTQEKDSATSQFFITKKPADQLTGEYAMFGRVFEGQNTVDKMKIGDVIRDITLSRPSGQDYSKVLRIEKPSQDPDGKNDSSNH
jgi:peptidyl-prolyl cis-trans isomerase B (cyclophilin B)